MGSSFGKNIKISIFGESHSYCVGLTIDGLKAGIYIDQIYLENELKKRKTHDDLSTSRNEEDKIVFLSGIFNNYTTGGPLTFILENNNQNSSSYQKGIIRPSHFLSFSINFKILFSSPILILVLTFHLFKISFKS